MRGMGVIAVAIAAVLACAPATAADTRAQAASAHAHKAAKKKGATTDKAFGREGDPRKVKRVIRVDMSDTMRFFPSEIRVKRGDTVRFAVRNSGQTPHEMVLGTMDELKQHAEHMRMQHGDMEHDEPYIAHVEPGEAGRIVWQFTRPGEFYYGCLVPGHFEAGMIGTIVVR
jgi:uncharacterized cupredoxin-like copper-binding protein